MTTAAAVKVAAKTRMTERTEEMRQAERMPMAAPLLLRATKTSRRRSLAST